MKTKIDRRRAPVERLFAIDDLKGTFGTDDPVEIMASVDPEAVVGSAPDGALEGFEKEAEEFKSIVLAAKKAEAKLDQHRRRGGLEYAAAKLGKTARQIREYCKLGLVRDAYQTPGGQWRVNYVQDTLEQIKTAIGNFSRNRGRCEISAAVENFMGSPPPIQDEVILGLEIAEKLTTKQYGIAAPARLLQLRKQRITESAVAKLSGLSRTTVRKRGFIKLGDSVAALEQDNRLYEQHSEDLAKRDRGYIELCAEPEVYNEDPEKLIALLKSHAEDENWAATHDISQTLIEVAPDEPLGWIYRSEALHQLKKTGEARDQLLRATISFPGHSQICYNLARYEWRLGRLDQAKNWLEKAFGLGNAKILKVAALADHELEPLWKKIKQ